MPLIVAIVLLVLLPFARAEDACLAQARDAYERLYCRVKAGGEGSNLPTLADFRRNPPQTQALLLRRPALRLGLTLPETPGGGLPAPAAPPAQAVAQVEVRQESDHSGLAACQLEGRLIHCGPDRFALVPNRPNNQLQPGALSAENSLELAPYEGHADDDEQLRAYLLNAYQVYIEKMLSIGLGGSTMTFTRFYYTWQQVWEQGGDFPARMSTMFSYLQRDKAAMGVQARYTEATPDSLEECGRLSQALVVCDRADVNWVYEKRR